MHTNGACRSLPTRRFFGCRRDQELLGKYLRRNSAHRQHQANRRGQRQRGLLEANSAGHGAITQRNSARFRFRRALSFSRFAATAGLQASPRRAAAEGLSCLLSWLEPCPGGIIWGRVRVPSPRRKVAERLPDFWIAFLRIQAQWADRHSAFYPAARAKNLASLLCPGNSDGNNLNACGARSRCAVSES